MNRFALYTILAVQTFLFLSCNEIIHHKQQAVIVHHCICDDDNCPTEFKLEDSATLTHIKNEFYKSSTGHLYEKTWSDQDLPGRDTLTKVLYFAGDIAQEIDPFTFEQIDGSFYAKDKAHIYYSMPTSVGMVISLLDSIDLKTFKLLAGHDNYAMDKNFFYYRGAIIPDFIPSKTKLKYDSVGSAKEIVSNDKTGTFEILN